MNQLADKKFNVNQIAVWLTVLANPIRFHVLISIGRQEKTVNELAQIIGISQPALSQHLAKLKANGMVKVRCEAQKRYYSLSRRSLYYFVQDIGVLVSEHHKIINGSRHGYQIAKRKTSPYAKSNKRYGG